MSEFIITNDMRREAECAVCCWLASVSDDGTPNVSPKELWRVHDDTSLTVANIASPVTMRNIQATGRACLSFIDILRQKGYKLTGSASYHGAQDAAYEELAGPLKEIAGDAFKVRGVFRIQPEAAAPIIAPSYYIRNLDEDEIVQQSLSTYGIRLAASE